MKKITKKEFLEALDRRDSLYFYCSDTEGDIDYFFTHPNMAKYVGWRFGTAYTTYIDFCDDQGYETRLSLDQKDTKYAFYKEQYKEGYVLMVNLKTPVFTSYLYYYYTEE